MSTTKKRKEKKRRQRTGVNRSREVKTIIIFNEGRGGGKKGGKKANCRILNIKSRFEFNFVENLLNIRAR